MIRVFLVTGNYLLLQGLVAVIASRPERLALVGSAPSPKEARAKLASAQPQVILLDVDDDRGHLPVLIEQTSARCNAKILLLTSQDGDALPGSAAALGARGVIDRRTTPELLLRALEKVHEGQLWINRAITERLAAGDADDPLGAAIALLTERERKVLEATVHYGGESAKVIASKLHIGESTIRNHLTSIYKKFDVSNRNGLLAYAAASGLTERLAWTSLAASARCHAELGAQRRFSSYESRLNNRTPVNYVPSGANRFKIE